MKTIKILLPVAALFVSALAFGQNGNGNSRVKVSTTTTTHRNGSVKSNEARVNGSINSNSHANQNAQRNANENSVLNGTTVLKKAEPQN